MTLAFARFSFAAATLGLASTVLGGCASTPVSFQPRLDAWTMATTSVIAGRGVQAKGDDGAALLVHPTFHRQPAGRPTFTLRVTNASAAPLVVTPDDLRAFFRGEPVALYTRAERMAEVRAAAGRREALHVALGTLAAVAVLWGVSTGWDGVISAGSGTLVVQTPLTGLVTGVVIAAGADEAVRQLEYGEAGEAAVAGAILDGSRTIAGGRSATLQLVLKDCCSGALRADDVVGIEVVLAGRRHAFAFQRVPADDPMRLLDP